MRNQLLSAGATLVLLTTGDVGPAQAQRVSADIHIGGWPIAGTIHIGDRYGRYNDRYYGRPRPARRVAVSGRAFPRVIVVERGRPYFKRGQKVKVVVAYFDRDCGLYFDRYRRGLDETLLFEHGNRHYRYDDRYDSRYYERDRYDRDEDRYRRDRRDRYGDYDDDYGAWEHDHRH